MWYYAVRVVMHSPFKTDMIMAMVLSAVLMAMVLSAAEAWHEQKDTPWKEGPEGDGSASTGSEI
jgi:hypothetical protein